MNAKEPKIAFLFDLDGVIIDSESQYTEIWRDIDRRFPTGVKNFPYVIKGRTLPDILDRFFPQDVREEVTSECYRMEQEMVYGYRKGSKETLDELSRRGIAKAMITSSDSVKMAHLWKDLPELKKCFPTVIDAEKVTRSKPDPQGYLLAAQALGADPRNCVVIEDSLQGVKAGKNAGCYVIGVKGTLPEESLREYCDEIVDFLDEIDILATIKLLSER